MARINFVELPSRDTGAMRDFYAQAFGWDFTDFGPTYACTMSGDVDLGIQADPEETTQAPLVAIEVDDLDTTYAAIRATGVTITREIFAFPGGRRFQFRDPSGNELAVHQPE